MSFGEKYDTKIHTLKMSGWWKSYFPLRDNLLLHNKLFCSTMKLLTFCYKSVHRHTHSLLHLTNNPDSTESVVLLLVLSTR